MQASTSAGTGAVGVHPHTALMNQFKSYVTMLADPECKDVLKLKATQELSKHFEVSWRTIIKASKNYIH